MAELYRDGLGIPHIRATTIRDLAFAQGEVTAQDRGWQIEVDRLRSVGRLAELVGESGVSWDVFARRARLADTARRAFDAQDDETRAFVTDYVAGVRQGMSADGCRAAEFAQLDALFGDRRPLEPWADHDPLGVLHVAHALFSTFPLMLWRQHVADTLGDDWVDVFGGFGEETVPASGSNAWALHGSRTRSGEPLLAGDPHRVFELPGVYQQVRLACNEFDVVGLAFPGVPGIAHFGHTGHAAWGVTNAMAHSVDAFRERLRATDAGYEALGPQGWEPTDVQRSTVTVRGSAPVDVEAIETDRGVIITDLRRSGQELVGYSVRMPARVKSDLGTGALLPLLRAQTAEDIVAAFGRWVDPVNRVFAADSRGQVRSATVGHRPARPRAQRRLPAPADAGPPAAVEESVLSVEVHDLAVDANERPTRADIDLGWAYPPPHRATRIRELLSSSESLTVDDFDPVWGDTRSGVADVLRAHLPTGPLGSAAAEVRDALVGWNGFMDASSAAAGLFAAWRSALVRRVQGHPALSALHAQHTFGELFNPWMSVAAQVAAALPRLLTHPTLRADIPKIVEHALVDAHQADTWGADHRLLPMHVFVDVTGIPDPGLVFDTPLPGDGDTVRCAGSTPGVTDRSWRGSVARWAWDLGDRERSTWSVPFGASGDSTSPHFGDQFPDWVRATPSTVVTDWARLRRHHGRGIV